MGRRKEFLDNLFSFFLAQGFKKKGNTLTYDKGNTVTIVNFQKSAFADCCYLNFGIFYKNKTQNINAATLKIQDAHFFGRYEAILGVKGDGITFPETEDVSTFSQKIILNISGKIIPFLEELTSVTYLKTILPKNIPWEKIWLQNILGAELLQLVESN